MWRHVPRWSCNIPKRSGNLAGLMMGKRSPWIFIIVCIFVSPFGLCLIHWMSFIFHAQGSISIFSCPLCALPSATQEDDPASAQFMLIKSLHPQSLASQTFLANLPEYVLSSISSSWQPLYVFVALPEMVVQDFTKTPQMRRSHLSSRSTHFLAVRWKSYFFSFSVKVAYEHVNMYTLHDRGSFLGRQTV